MGRVREKKRWRKEKKMERDRRRRDQPPFNLVLHPPLVLTDFLTHP